MYNYVEAGEQTTTMYFPSIITVLSLVFDELRGATRTLLRRGLKNGKFCDVILMT